MFILSIDWKSNNYDLILIIINCLTKIKYHKLVKVTINAPKLAKIIINIIMWYDNPQTLSLVNAKQFLRWSFGFYFITSLTSKNTSLLHFIFRKNGKQNNCAQLLTIAEFAYNNPQNASTSHKLFMLNCGYHSWAFFKDECNAYFRSFSANGLATELRKLMNIYW